MTILALIRIFKQVDSPIQYLTSVRQVKNVDAMKNHLKLAQTHIMASTSKIVAEIYVAISWLSKKRSPTFFFKIAWVY